MEMIFIQLEFYRYFYKLFAMTNFEYIKYVANDKLFLDSFMICFIKDALRMNKFIICLMNSALALISVSLGNFIINLERREINWVLIKQVSYF